MARQPVHFFLALPIPPARQSFPRSHREVRMPCPECRAQTGSDHRYCAYCGFPLRPETLASDHHLPPGEAACERWQKVAARYPDRPEAHYNLGLAHYHLGHIDDAIAALERAVAIEDALPHA